MTLFWYALSDGEWTRRERWVESGSLDDIRFIANEIRSTETVLLSFMAADDRGMIPIDELRTRVLLSRK